MKIKLGELYGSKNALKKVFKFDLPIPVLYEHKKDFKKLTDEISVLDSIQGDLIKKFGIKVNAIDYGIPNPTEENEKKYGISLEELKNRFDNYLNTFNEVLDKDIDLDIKEIRREEIESKENKLSYEDCILLEWILKG